MPGPTGLEHLRAMQAAARYPNGAVADLQRRYGHAFVFGFGPLRFHWLIGPDANRAVLHEQRHAFGLRGAYGFLTPIGGPDALIASDEPEHLQRRRAVQPAFHPDHHRRWLQRIAAGFDGWAQAHAHGAPFDAHAALRAEVLRLVCDVLLGDGVRSRHPTLERDMGVLMDFTNLPMAAQLARLPLPGTPWARFAAARRRVDRAVRRELARPPAHDEPGSEGGGAALALLRRAAPAAAPTNGRRPPLADAHGGSLRDQLVGLLAAAFDTTSAALSWTLCRLLTHPRALAEVRDELRSASLEEALRAPATDAVFKETLRLYPPASACLRRTREPQRVLGFALPAGSRVALSLYLTHRDGARWPEPRAWRPERWRGASLPAGADDPFGYLPFGYGARYCIGAPLARAVVKGALWALLPRYELEPGWREPPAEWGTTLQPRGGLPLALRPLAVRRGVRQRPAGR